MGLSRWLNYNPIFWPLQLPESGPIQCKLPSADLDPGAEMSPSAGVLEQALLGLFWLNFAQMTPGKDTWCRYYKRAQKWAPGPCVKTVFVLG